MKNLSSNKLRSLIQSYAIVSSSLNSDEILKKIMNEACNLLKAQAASIFLFDDAKDELYMKVSTNLTKKQIAKIRVPVGKGIVGYVAEKGKLLNISDMRKDPRFYDKVDKITGLTTKSLLTVPLHVENKLVGAAQVLNKKGKKSFDKEDEILFTEFARLACITLDKAWLHEQLLIKERFEADLQLACSIQNRLLPKDTLSIDGYRLKGFYKPARFVGGDYYDYFSLANDETFFTIADVTGKGAQASLLMAIVKAYLSASFKDGNPLINVVNRLNEFFFKNSPVNVFVTMFFGILNSKTGELSYINAGHEPPIIIRKNKTLEELSPTGLIVGIMETTQFNINKMVLEQGDVLFTFTDGITEAMNAKGEQFGNKKLRAVLTASNETPEKYFEIIPSEIKKHSKSVEQSDDITFLVVY